MHRRAQWCSGLVDCSEQVIITVFDCLASGNIRQSITEPVSVSNFPAPERDVLIIQLVTSSKSALY